MPSPIPEKILRLARAVRGEGGRALMVGGCVRDRLMGRGAKDWDVEVYGVEPARLRELLELQHDRGVVHFRGRKLHRVVRFEQQTRLDLLVSLFDDRHK